MPKTIILILAILTSAASAEIALNPDVTPATMGTTICVPGYAASVRPPSSYTNRIKRGLLAAAGQSWSHARRYELDHTVPLTLGGSPRSPDNLQLQKWGGPDGARAKDRLEVRLKRLVCAGRLPLAEAQQCIYSDWQACAVKHPPTNHPKGKSCSRKSTSAPWPQSSGWPPSSASTSGPTWTFPTSCWPAATC